MRVRGRRSEGSPSGSSDLGQCRLDASGLDDRVAPLHAFDGTGDDEFLTLQEIIENLLTLRIRIFCRMTWLGGLRADAPELYRFERLFDEIIDLEIRSRSWASVRAICCAGIS